MKVKITVTPAEGDAYSSEIKFNCPAMLALVNDAPDGSSVSAELVPEEGEQVEETKLLSGTKEEAVTAISRSVVPQDGVVNEFRRLAQFMLDHSNLKGAIISLISSDGKEMAKQGFGLTAQDCTFPLVEALIECDRENCAKFSAAIDEKRNPAEGSEPEDKEPSDAQ